MKIYLAGPLLATPERDWSDGLAARLTAGGHDVYLPQAHPAVERTGRAIFLKDLEGLDWADGVVAIMARPPSAHRGATASSKAQGMRARVEHPCRDRSVVAIVSFVGDAHPCDERVLEAGGP